MWSRKDVTIIGYAGHEHRRARVDATIVCESCLVRGRRSGSRPPTSAGLVLATVVLAAVLETATDATLVRMPPAPLQHICTQASAHPARVQYSFQVVSLLYLCGAAAHMPAECL